MKAMIKVSVLVVLFVSGLGYYKATKAMSLKDQTCEGNACQVITRRWDDAAKKQLFKNNGDKTVSLKVNGVWGGTSVTLDLAPNEEKAIFFQAYTLPYYANYK